MMFANVSEKFDIMSIEHFWHSMFDTLSVEQILFLTLKVSNKWINLFDAMYLKIIF